MFELKKSMLVGHHERLEKLENAIIYGTFKEAMNEIDELKKLDLDAFDLMLLMEYIGKILEKGKY